MKVSPFILAIVFVVSTFTPLSQLLAQDSSRGQQLYEASCLSCHGSQGQGSLSDRVPMIGGQFDWYIVTALEDFQSGDREYPMNNPYIENLSEQDMNDLAAYISQLVVEELGE